MAKVTLAGNWVKVISLGSFWESGKTYQLGALCQWAPPTNRHWTPSPESLGEGRALESKGSYRLIISKEAWPVVDNTFEEGQRLSIRGKDSLRIPRGQPGGRKKDEAPTDPLRREKMCTQTTEAIATDAVIIQSLPGLQRFPSSYLLLPNQTDPNLNPAYTWHNRRFPPSEDASSPRAAHRLLLPSPCGFLTHSQSCLL